MKLRVPLKWIVVQGGYGHISELVRHVDLYKTYAAGGDGHGTEYEKYLQACGNKTPERIEEILAMRRKLAAGPPSDLPLPVVLNADGKFELTDGHHRAARLVYENAEAADVEVQSISPSWQNMVEQLESIYPNRTRPLYQEIEHPFFADWEVSRDAKRLGMVVEAVHDAGIKPTDGDYLEIGSCTGRFCREFNRLGWCCYGVDLDRRVVIIAEYLSRVFGTTVSYHCTSDWDATLSSGPGWGIVLSLSVFHSHHTSGHVAMVRQVFRRCLDRCKVFITDGDAPGRVYNGGVAWPQEQYQAWLTELAAPTHDVKSIGATENRTMYLCKRR